MIMYSDKMRENLKNVLACAQRLEKTFKELELKAAQLTVKKAA